MINAAQSRYPSDLQRAAHPGPGQLECMAEDLVDFVKDYAREKPTATIIWALGIGFVLGWKLKPW